MFGLIFNLWFLLLFSMAHSQSLLEPLYVSDTPIDSFATFESVLASPVSFERYKIQQEASFNRLSDLVRQDSSVGESYNSVGYWDQLTIRGIKLSNRSNYFRNGLPISAETVIALENKQEMQILKGLSGLQFGAPSPAGLVNYRTKTPDFDKNYNTLSLGATSAYAALLHLDSNVSTSESSAWRSNLSLNSLNTHVENTNGKKEFVSLAYAKKIADNFLELEWEFLNQSQYSQAALSLMGQELPPLRPNLNLNNQPWSNPVEFKNHTASLSLTRPLSPSAYLKFQIGAQWLKTQDNLAYPFGCAKENQYDRFCTDGTFDMYDFRSKDESRQVLAANLEIQKQWDVLAVKNESSFGFMVSDARDWFHKQAYNYVGQGSVLRPPTLPEDSTPTDENTNHLAKNIQFSLNNKARYHDWEFFSGLRFINLNRKSFSTDSSRHLDYSQNQVTPWLAVGYKFSDHYTYLSYSEGLESYVVPNRSSYDNPGQPLPDTRSAQVEWGLKSPHYDVSLFSVRRPYLIDEAPNFAIDGSTTVSGGEIGTKLETSYLDVLTDVTYLQAHRPSFETKYLPQWSGRLNFLTPSKRSWVAGLHFTYNSGTSIDSVKIPDWVLVNLSATYAWQKSELGVFVHNLLDRKYYRDVSEQYGHYFLFPEKQSSVFINYRLYL